MLKRILVVTGIVASASCAGGEELDGAMLHGNAGSGGESGGNVAPGTGGNSTPTGSGGNGQSGSTGQSGSLGHSGSGGNGGSGGSGGAPQGDASAGSAGQSSGGAAGTGGMSGGAGSGGNPLPMSDAGFVAGFKVLYANMQTASTNSSYIGCELHATNAGPNTIAVNELKLRYYFTNDPAKPPKMNINWGFTKNPGAQWDMTVTWTVNPIAPPKNNADTYFEFSFSSPNHTNLSPNEEARFSWQVEGPNPSTDKYTQSNDYSWDLGRTTIQEWDHVVLLRNGAVVWGTPP